MNIGWGTYSVDQLQWWADELKMGIPVEYKTTGKIPTPNGLYNTVQTWDMEATYANSIKVWFTDTGTARHKKHAPDMEKLEKFVNCTQFVGDKGWVAGREK